MKVSRTAKVTTNRAAYNRAIKRLRENRGQISCSHCPYHKRENANRMKRR